MKSTQEIVGNVRRRTPYVNNNPDIAQLFASYNVLVSKYPATYVVDIVDKAVMVPCSIFSKEIGYIDALVVYMVENLHISVEDVSEMLNRDISMIKKVYAKNRSTKIGVDETSKYNYIKIPLIIFKNRNLSIFENVVKYLKEVYDLRLSQIAEILNKDQRTIWTVYNRASKKMI